MSRQYKGTVLIVDDDDFVLESVALLLERYGFQPVACKYAEEAVAKFRETRIDVVLTDIRMPVISGIELLEKIRGMDSETPVILMTAYADLNIAIDAIKKGAFDFLVKPYKPEQLVYSVEKAVRYSSLVNMEKEYKSLIEEFNRDLETLVSERTMSLMALAVADRVRNPASAITWICRRTLEKEKMPEAVSENLKKIITEAERLEKIVKDFQAILKDRRSMFEYEDINQIVRAIISIMEKEAEKRGIKMNVDLSDQPLRINVQKNLFRVAVFQLLRNSFDSTSEGGTISVSSSGNSSGINLIISDTGYGIPESDIDRIFDPFFSTKKHRFGMGLPIVKQIIEEHLGRITVRSEPGKGTTFELFFPARWVEKVPVP